MRIKMCGILVASGVDLDTFTRAFKLVEHRGTRSHVVDHGGVWFGHARLPIIGTSAEFDQPVPTGHGGLLGFVGELLDFREYPSGKSMQCDLEMVRRAWAKRGPRGFSTFDGFWSVVHVSGGGADYQVVDLVADYLCQKPLYYRGDAVVVGAASEPAAVAALAPTTPDEVYLSAVTKWGYCPETWRTPYREVAKILPGEHVTLHPRRPGLVERELVDGLVLEKFAGDLRVEIESAVKRRVLSSDVPVAALVSGGLDSAIVYRLASRYGDVVPYYVDDGNGARAQAVVGSRGARVVGGIDSPVDDEDALTVMQEPVDLGSLVPQLHMSRAINEDVCLTGDGADEFFGGYGRAGRYDSQQSDVYHELVAWHLPRLDRVMMGNRVEVRSPFLSRRVAVMALGLPRELRTDKKILRDLYRRELGSDIVDQVKRPLRTSAVEVDREGRSAALVKKFRRMTWPELA